MKHLLLIVLALNISACATVSEWANKHVDRSGGQGLYYRQTEAYRMLEEAKIRSPEMHKKVQNAVSEDVILVEIVKTK